VSDYAIVVASEAEAELAEARDRYRAISPGLEARFRAEVEATVEAFRRTRTDTRWPTGPCGGHC
jgi:hypothetical protein